MIRNILYIGVVVVLFLSFTQNSHSIDFSSLADQSSYLNAAADVILAAAGLVEKDPSSIIELDINPLLLLAEGRGAVAADALVSLNANPGVVFLKCLDKAEQES